MRLTRELLVEHRKTLGVSHGEPAIKAIVSLAQHDFERVKDDLVDCEPEQFLTLQGEARGYKAILKYLTASSPKV